jgi:hypothetical protein
MIVEPFANESVGENLNAVGRICYSGSTMICTGASMAQEVGLALGAQAGDYRLRNLVLRGGFSRFRRAAQTPFNGSSRLDHRRRHLSKALTAIPKEQSGQGLSGQEVPPTGG